MDSSPDVLELTRSLVAGWRNCLPKVSEFGRLLGHFVIGSLGGSLLKISAVCTPSNAHARLGRGLYHPRA